MDLRTDQLKEGVAVDSKRARRSLDSFAGTRFSAGPRDASGTEFIELTRTLTQRHGACITAPACEARSGGSTYHSGALIHPPQSIPSETPYTSQGSSPGNFGRPAVIRVGISPPSRIGRSSSTFTYTGAQEVCIWLLRPARRTCISYLCVIG